jgi:sugar lactone lactonase YvrE
VAGTAPQPGSADGAGAAARFQFPVDVTSDGRGSLFVTDCFNDEIRKIEIATGAVTTLAGAPGQPGSADGSGATARFNCPYGIVLDGQGNLLVADVRNHTIREVVIATGAVTTLAGSAGSPGTVDGTGAAARFYGPRSLASDGHGNVYVSEATSIIRKIAVATAEVSTVAGAPGMKGSADGIGPAARFDTPAGLAFDADGNLYVADAVAGTVRKIVLATGEVSTLAGAPGVAGSDDGPVAAARFSSPRALASDGGGHLYVTDAIGSTLREIDLAAGMVTTVAGQPGVGKVVPGPLPALLNNPQGIAILPSGDIALTDENAVLIIR